MKKTYNIGTVVRIVKDAGYAENTGAIGVVVAVSSIDCSYPYAVRRVDEARFIGCIGLATRVFRHDELDPVDAGVAALYGIEQKET